MDDVPASPPSPYDRPRPGPKLSKTPSWVMLGFVLGALVVYAWMRQPEPGPPPEARRPVEEPGPAAPREPPRLTTVEAVFEVWGEHAVWSDNLTEIALWNPRERAFSDFYEVRRVGGKLYFRSLPALTRRIIRRGKELPESPLQFTETEQQYREWLEHGRTERRPDPPLPPPKPGPSR